MPARWALAPELKFYQELRICLIVVSGLPMEEHAFEAACEAVRLATIFPGSSVCTLAEGCGAVNMQQAPATPVSSTGMRIVPSGLIFRPWNDYLLIIPRPPLHAFYGALLQSRQAELDEFLKEVLDSL